MMIGYNICNNFFMFNPLPHGDANRYDLEGNRPVTFKIIS